MKTSKLNLFAARYLGSLKAHLEEGPELGLTAARKLGIEAVALGLETLKIAIIHEQSRKVLTLLSWSPAKCEVMTSRATLFFSEVVTPIENTHPASLRSTDGMKRSNISLKRRTRQLAASTLVLRKGLTSARAPDGISKPLRNPSNGSLQGFRFAVEFVEP